MECTFSPALVAKPKIITSERSSAFGCLPFADGDENAGGGGGDRGKEPVHERLYKMRGRSQVKGRAWCRFSIVLAAVEDAAVA